MVTGMKQSITMFIGSTNSFSKDNRICKSFDGQSSKITFGSKTFTLSLSSDILINGLGYLKNKSCLHVINKKEICINLSSGEKNKFEAILEILVSGKLFFLFF